MKLYLSELDQSEVTGSYGPKRDRLAARMVFLHPDAAKSFLEMNSIKTIKCSDMYRTFEASRKAHANKGAARAGYSGHNFGFSIDIDTRWVIKTNNFANKVELDAWMETYGWYCHNPPGETRPRESWHFNYFGDEAAKYLKERTANRRTWSKPLEKKVTDVYGFWWHKATIVDVQDALFSLNMYKDDPSGVEDAYHREAVTKFQKLWNLSPDGIAGTKTVRTLMCVTSERIILDEVC